MIPVITLSTAHSCLFKNCFCFCLTTKWAHKAFFTEDKKKIRKKNMKVTVTLSWLDIFKQISHPLTWKQISEWRIHVHTHTHPQLWTYRNRTWWWCFTTCVWLTLYWVYTFCPSTLNLPWSHYYAKQLLLKLLMKLRAWFDVCYSSVVCVPSQRACEDGFHTPSCNITGLMDPLGLKHNMHQCRLWLLFMIALMKLLCWFADFRVRVICV